MNIWICVYVTYALYYSVLCVAIEPRERVCLCVYAYVRKYVCVCVCVIYIAKADELILMKLSTIDLTDIWQ